jgi:hypothetical protein
LALGFTFFLTCFFIFLAAMIFSSNCILKITRTTVLRKSAKNRFWAPPESRYCEQPPGHSAVTCYERRSGWMRSLARAGTSDKPLLPAAAPSRKLRLPQWNQSTADTRTGQNDSQRRLCRFQSTWPFPSARLLSPRYRTIASMVTF